MSKSFSVNLDEELTALTRKPPADKAVTESYLADLQYRLGDITKSAERANLLRIRLANTEMSSQHEPEILRAFCDRLRETVPPLLQVLQDMRTTQEELEARVGQSPAYREYYQVGHTTVLDDNQEEEPFDEPPL